MDYAVIGLGTFGTSVAIQLTKMGNDVLAIDKDAEKVKKISNDVAHTAILDGTDEKALKEVSIAHADFVIVGMGENAIMESTLTCLALKNVGAEYIIAKCTNSSHEEILKKIEVDETINPEQEMGERLAKRLQSQEPFEGIKLSDSKRISSFKLTDKSKKLIDKTVQEINLRKKFNINIVCVKRGEDVIIAESDTMLLAKDIILIAGDVSQIQSFEEKYTVKEK
ncbi:MAG: potassium channel family protein [Mycoplasmatales bacterium]